MALLLPEQKRFIWHFISSTLLPHLQILEVCSCFCVQLFIYFSCDLLLLVDEDFIRAAYTPEQFSFIDKKMPNSSAFIDLPCIYDLPKKPQNQTKSKKINENINTKKPTQTKKVGTFLMTFHSLKHALSSVISLNSGAVQSTCLHLRLSLIALVSSCR